MFTGIVTDIGTVTTVESPGDTRVVVSTAYDTATVDLGASRARRSAAPPRISGRRGASSTSNAR
jgi:riboflavin synthase alpha subunit